MRCHLRGDSGVVPRPVHRRAVTHVAALEDLAHEVLRRGDCLVVLCRAVPSAEALQENGDSLVLSAFPYVCPEPVLANVRFFSIKLQTQKRRLTLPLPP